MQIKAKKSLGQNFLRCGWVVDTLIRAAELTSEDTVLEIGPGTGVLTRALAAAAGKVVAVEKDGQLALALRDALAKEGVANVDIITADILKILPDLSLAYNPLPTTYKLIANIPYYITGQLLRLLFECNPLPQSIVLTLQKEVAERIIAKPPHMNPVRSKTPQASAVPTRSGRTSNGMNMIALSVQAFGTPEIIAVVPASCFFPQPKVDSAILKISGVSGDFFAKNKIEKSAFFEAARAGFSQKRKMLVNSLGTYLGDKKSASEIIEEAGIEPRARPEALSLAQWANITRRIAARRQ